MHRFDDRWVVSAADLVDATECGHRLVLSHAVAAGARTSAASGAAAGPAVSVAPNETAPLLVVTSGPDAVAVRHGEAHERRWLEHFRRLFGPAGVVEIERPDTSGGTVNSLTEAAAVTRRALAAGVPVVYQAVLFDGEFQGRPDFLVAAHLDPVTGAARADVARGGGYEPYDAKLARHARPGAVLQLASYAVALPSAGVPVPEWMHLLQPAPRAGAVDEVAGRTARRPWSAGEDNVVRSFRVDDVAPMVAHARRRLATRLAADPRLPDPAWDEPRPACATCAFATHCEQGRERARDLSLVAGLRADQRRKLRAAEITTVEQLASAADDNRPPTMSEATFAGLRVQAELQARQDATRTAEDRTGTVTVRVVAPDGLASLPPPDPGDVYFDMEGDPYAVDAAGLEYLFGAVTLDDPPPTETLPTETLPTETPPTETFHAFWAHDRPAEKAAFERFVDWTTARLADRPKAHVYHYAPYEPNALKRLAARHGTRENQVDDLLRDGRLIDLYTVVRRSLKISQRSYSIKYLEPLYMPGARAGGGVTNAADSIVAYEGYLAHRAAGDTDAAERVLGEIADYNRVDCVSTLRLHRWLLDLADTEGVPLAAPPAGDGGVLDPLASPDTLAADPSDSARAAADAERDALVDALVAGLPADPSGWTADERARALLAASVGYHRRENKPAWWEFFAWLSLDRAALESDDHCAVPVRWDLVEDWATVGRQRKPRRTLRVATDPDNPHPFQPRDRVRLLYPGPAGAPGATTDAVVERAEPDSMVLVESVAKDDVVARLPTAVLPGEPVRPEPKPAAVAELAKHVAAALPRLPPGPGTDLLLRRPPRLRGRGFPEAAALPVLAEFGGDQIAAVLAAVDALDGSCLAVQGPPGAGKTYLAGRLIRHLVGQGRTVGVCSNSHKAIENTMLAAFAVDAAGAESVSALPAAKKARAGQRPPASPPRPDGPASPAAAASGGPPWAVPRDLSALVAWRAEHSDGHLVGDTAWLFANERIRAEPFDVVIVDEAGQFALADTLAVAGAARNLVLLGDPQQLPQVVAGIHPDGADASALSHLLGEAEVIPPALGYFLDLTRRMHPAVCAPVSALAYRGRLHAHPVTEGRSIAGVPAGLYLRDVDHHGNTTRSDEEIAAVRDVVTAVLGRDFADVGSGAGAGAGVGAGVGAGAGPRPIEPRDVLVVAPYNRQVRAIEHALVRSGVRGVRVGTVDRFQGQEAPVVVTSLTTSSAAEAPRGLDFLLSRNRLNVALSRAQVLAVLVMSPALLDSAPRTVDELRLLAGLARLRTSASPWPLAGTRPLAGTESLAGTGSVLPAPGPVRDAEADERQAHGAATARSVFQRVHRGA